MVNLRFWSTEPAASPQAVSDLSGSDQSCSQHLADAFKSSKRRRSAFDGDDEAASAGPAKQARIGTLNLDDDSRPVNRRDQVRDTIIGQFDLEMLLKHKELRLVEQELGKCQIALEQLRRCHLVPYPVNCPTPDQMLNIKDGKGPAITTRPGEPVPKWAPPFGVVDGPYARHYAKWLIPHPDFDGMQPECQLAPEHARARGSISEGRATRNSFTEPTIALKGRPVRGSVSQKLQALPSGYPPPKERAGPCLMKRGDGVTVKLVCLTCQREDFSSTQGFINHCRIAHKCEFKSHEEAAMRSGQPIDVTATGTVAVEEKPSQGSSGSATVHAFAREDISEQEAYALLKRRVTDILKSYQPDKQSDHDGLRRPVGAATESANTFESASDTPHLSQFMKNRRFNGSLHDVVTDAKTKISPEDISTGEESDDMDCSSDSTKDARPPVVMRTPARTLQSIGSAEPGNRPTSSKGRISAKSYASPSPHILGTTTDEDVEMEDANLSPNALASNIAPSLVSDDGEYDSDEGSSVSGSGDSLEAESISDVAEISVDDEHETQALRRGSNSITPAVKFRKGDTKQVTFMAPVKTNAKDRRLRKV